MSSYAGLRGVCEICGQDDYHLMEDSGHYGIDGVNEVFMCPSCAENLLFKYTDKYGSDVFEELCAILKSECAERRANA